MEKKYCLSEEQIGDCLDLGAESEHYPCSDNSVTSTVAGIRKVAAAEHQAMIDAGWVPPADYERALNRGLSAISQFEKVIPK